MRRRPVVYLLHFQQPYKHAKHYLGAARIGALARLQRHELHRGARLIQVIGEAGIGFDLVRVWYCRSRDQAFQLERRLKKHSSTRECPICNIRKRRHLTRKPLPDIYKRS